MTDANKIKEPTNPVLTGTIQIIANTSSDLNKTSKLKSQLSIDITNLSDMYGSIIDKDWDKFLLFFDKNEKNVLITALSPEIDHHKETLTRNINILSNLIDQISAIDNENENASEYLEIISLPFVRYLQKYHLKNYFSFVGDITSAYANLYSASTCLSTIKDKTELFHESIKNEISQLIVEAKNELVDFRKLKSQVKNSKVQSFYELEAKKYFRYALIYRVLFLIFIGLAAYISWWMVEGITSALTDLESTLSSSRVALDVFEKKYTPAVSFTFWFSKITLLIAFLSVITYFLKQSNHYQKLGDQANQTDLELKSLPSFISGLSSQDELEIRKELALKYFGKQTDGSTSTDMSNLLADQMKSTTEMVKATTEALKAVYPPKIN
ncbi:hypothetical protein F892_01729 [Acinetobacter vivianii]|uniref:Uncharacterized protein n=1 Tax=Acinetobacter vivianii TaxID=1776742 RepID=N9Q6B1_9GAMM|nr:hypothetical protein [Acinetobacter vivianii]ENX22487.1 hypothetical protein F892_01729 [Acinetobacter vivianii]GGI58857.1 hypothetical protein GCM10011446_03520 [Acinetobacter vivianii]